jgi:hypothetical protein
VNQLAQSQTLHFEYTGGEQDVVALVTFVLVGFSRQPMPPPEYKFQSIAATPARSVGMSRYNSDQLSYVPNCAS